MNFSDIVVEIMKYLKTIDLLHFSLVKKRNYKLLNKFIENINQECFFLNNDIRILNRSYELHLKQLINISDFENIKYHRKNKKEYALFTIDETRIKIYKNRIKISGTKSLSEYTTILNELLKIQISEYNLIHISTSLFFNDKLKHKDYKDMSINNNHCHITADLFKFNIYNTNITCISTRRINKTTSYYNKFKVFYLTDTRFIM